MPLRRRSRRRRCHGELGELGGVRPANVEDIVRFNLEVVDQVRRVFVEIGGRYEWRAGGPSNTLINPCLQELYQFVNSSVTASRPWLRERKGEGVRDNSLVGTKAH